MTIFPRKKQRFDELSYYRLNKRFLHVMGQCTTIYLSNREDYSVIGAHHRIQNLDFTFFFIYLQ